MIKALENNENTARVLQHKPKRVVHRELSQYSVKVALPSLKPETPINPGAMRSLQATNEQEDKGIKKSKAANPAQCTTKSTKGKWEPDSESEAEESIEPEEDADGDKEEDDNSDKCATRSTPAKALKWSYVRYQDETSDRWRMAPGIARQFYKPRGHNGSD